MISVTVNEPLSSEPVLFTAPKAAECNGCDAPEEPCYAIHTTAPNRWIVTYCTRCLWELGMAVEVEQQRQEDRREMPAAKRRR